jgi:hypothetical protein
MMPSADLPAPGTFAFALGFVAAALSSMLTVRSARSFFLLGCGLAWKHAKMIQNVIVLE